MISRTTIVAFAVASLGLFSSFARANIQTNTRATTQSCPLGIWTVWTVSTRVGATPGAMASATVVALKGA